MCSCLFLLQMRDLNCWGFQHYDSWVSYLCSSTNGIHTHTSWGADLPCRIVRKFSLLAPLQRLLPSPSFGRLAKTGCGRESLTASCCCPRFVFRRWTLVSCQAGYLAVGTQMWACPGGMLMHYRLFPIGGVSCLMLCGGSSRSQGCLVGTAPLRAIWQIHFKTSFWHIIIRKKWSPAFREWKENFLLNEVLKTVGLLQD